MRPDQERVKNLLIDTVTLLVKNSIQFDKELNVEGLLGVSVDKTDTFFVHITKEFSNSPTGGASVNEKEPKTPTDTSQTEENREHSTDRSHVPPETVRIKTETYEEENDECSIVEDPSIKLEGVASPAQVVAGQRRPYKRHHSQQQQQTPGGGGGDYHNTLPPQYTSDDSNLSGVYPPTYSDSYNTGEPPIKRLNTSQEEEEDYGSGGDPNTDSAQGWPTMGEYNPADMSQTFSQTDNASLSGDGSQQPGCSSWQEPSDSVANEETPNVWVPTPSVAKDSRTGHRCYFCCKAYSNKYNLARHVRSHTGEKPFPCSKCNRGFTVKTSMLRHMKICPVSKADSKL